MELQRGEEGLLFASFLEAVRYFFPVCAPTRLGYSLQFRDITWTGSVPVPVRCKGQYLFSLRWSPSSPSVNISKTKLTLSWTYLPNHGCFLFRLPGVMSEHLGFLCLHQYPESRISIPSSFTVSSSSFLSLCLLSAPPQTCTFWPLASLVSQLSALFQHITLDQPS